VLFFAYTLYLNKVCVKGLG